VGALGVPLAIHVYIGCCENSKELRDRSSKLPKELRILVTAIGILDLANYGEKEAGT
jgi:hypothetical protein